MQTIERPEAPHAPSGDTKLKRRNRLLTWLVGVLAVAVIGLGAWLIADAIAGDDLTAVPEGVEAALDTYDAAWVGTDREAFINATTDDYTFVSDMGAFGQASQALQVGGLTYFEFEELGRVGVGDGSSYYVASEQRVRFAANGLWYDGISVVTLVEVDGTWKVGQHTWHGEIP